MDLEHEKLLKQEYEKRRKMSPMRKMYEKYKRDFINNRGYEQGYELLSYEEYKEYNEEDC
jgi:hypothetical protein